MTDKIIIEAEEVLLQLIESTQMLSSSEYTQKLSLLSNSSIGEHTRHIIELFQQLLKGYDSALVEYDKRERNQSLQEHTNYAIDTLSAIIQALNKENKQIQIQTEWNSNESPIDSNYFRELMYNIEHCVHHQAIIKIGFLSLGKMELIENFGVAKSTIKYRENCAQ